MKYSINTPEGTRDRLFAECRDRRQCPDALTALFRRRGYAEVSTPEVEFYDLFLQSGNPMPQEAMLKIVDRSGKIMVMRPDCTTPIARVAATKLKAVPLPQRLYYDRDGLPLRRRQHRGGSSEIAQCGVELIGAAGKKADLEVIALAVDALRACGLARFHIELGHAGLLPVPGRPDGHGRRSSVEKMRAPHRGQEFRRPQRPAGALRRTGRPAEPLPALPPLRRGGGAGRGRGPGRGERGRLTYLRDL